MTKKSDGQVIREVTERIDAAIALNRHQERIVAGALVVLFAVGVSLIVWGAATNRLAILVPGGILQLTIAYPVRLLIKLREDNLRLQILPQLLRLAETEEAKVLAAKLVTKLIKQV